MPKRPDTVTIRIKRFVKYLLIDAFGNREYGKFVIIGKQRTGSSLLVWLLRSHRLVEVPGEAFRLLRGASCREVWSRVFSKQLPWIRYVGFKIFYFHPEDSEDREVWNLLKDDPSIKIIHIRRENLLRTYVSKRIAEKTGAWNSRQEGDTLSATDKRVTIDIEKCLEEFRRTRRWESEYGKNLFPQHEYFELTYEELTSDLPGKMEGILNFLGLPQKVFKSKLKRQNPEPVEELIANYPELKEALRNTEFADLVATGTRTEALTN